MKKVLFPFPKYVETRTFWAEEEDLLRPPPGKGSLIVLTSACKNRKDSSLRYLQTAAALKNKEQKEARRVDGPEELHSRSPGCHVKTRKPVCSLTEESSDPNLLQFLSSPHGGSKQPPTGYQETTGSDSMCGTICAPNQSLLLWSVSVINL